MKENLAKLQERIDYEKNRMVVYSQGDEGATEIGKQLLNNKYLKRLRLIDAQIGPKGCKAMAPAIKRHRRLEHLGLKFNLRPFKGRYRKFFDITAPLEKGLTPKIFDYTFFKKCLFSKKYFFLKSFFF